MIEINTESKIFDFAVNLVSTLIGFAAGGLVGGIFNSTISQYSGITRCAMEAGRLGIETVVTYEVASTMSDEIRDDVYIYNKLASEINAGRALLEHNKEVNNA